MAVIKKRTAVDRLLDAVRIASADDLAEVYRELHPDAPLTEPDVAHRLDRVRADVLDHVGGRLAAEQLVDVWNVVFPAHARVWFDEDEDALHYQQEPEPAGAVDEQ